MKVLYVTGLFRKKSCSASIRNVALVNGLQESGCDVSVLTVKFPIEVLDTYLVESVNKSVKIIEVDAGYISKYIPSIYSVNKKSSNVFFLKKLIKNIIYFPGIDKGWIKSISPMDYVNFDYIISSSDTKTSHFVAEKIQKDNPRKWLQIWGDPWADDVGIDNFILKYRAFKAENKLLKSGQIISYVSRPTANAIALKFPNLIDNIEYIPRNFFRSVERIPRQENVFRISYTGVMNGRDIVPILGALKIYNAQQKLRVTLDVYGRVTSEQHVLLENSPYATFNGEVSLEKVFEVFEASDALLYLGNAAGSSQIPGKLYDYFGTNLPILALVQNMHDEVTKFILESERCVVNENKVEAISINHLIKRRNKYEVLHQYSPRTVALRVIDLLKAK